MIQALRMYSAVRDDLKQDGKKQILAIKKSRASFILNLYKHG